MPKITIYLSALEKLALIAYAASEQRDFRSQAYVIIKRELEKREKLISSNTNGLTQKGIADGE